MTTKTALPMPPMAIRLMQDTDERLLQTGGDLARLVYSYGLKSDQAVLDVGSCYGRLPLGLLSVTDYRGRYQGFDVLPKQVEWCQAELTPYAPNFTFKHLDVHNARYNPHGKVDPTKLKFPIRTATIDCCTLFSIFTHFYRADIERYLGEIARTLKPGGMAVTTWFLFDDERLPLVTAPTSGYPMVHRLDESTIFAEIEDPLRAIAFDEALVRAMAADAGLVVERIDRGTWAGEPGLIFQDVVVLRRPGGLYRVVRSRLGSIKRAAARRRRARAKARARR